MSWINEQVFCLITIWSNEKLQLLEGSKRNQAIFDHISRVLGEAGYMKSATQCKEKLKKLKARYKKLKDGHDVALNKIK